MYHDPKSTAASYYPILSIQNSYENGYEMPPFKNQRRSVLIMCRIDRSNLPQFLLDSLSMVEVLGVDQQVLSSALR